MSAESYFSQSYAEARGKFLAAADAAGLYVHSHIHPMRGRDGEELAMDVALLGAADAQRLLIISSACHGVEGYCGSGVQNALLADGTFQQAVRTAGTAVLFIHALNPYGFSWWRRVTHENVDLNRNFHDFHAPLPANLGYDEVAHLVVPATWPPSPENEAAIRDYVATRGEKAWQQALSAGQHSHPQGIFFGGHTPTWSHQTLRHVLQEHGQRCARLGWIDLHTGLGPNGHGERIFAGPNDNAMVARARAWWGPQVTSIYDGSSTSAVLTGLMWSAAQWDCPQAEYTGLAMEYGTLPVMEVMQNLRAEQWLENHPQAPEEQRRAIKQSFRDAFYTDTPLWKQQILDQAREATLQALSGLSGLSGLSAPMS
jgi:hypothetical protein